MRSKEGAREQREGRACMQAGKVAVEPKCSTIEPLLPEAVCVARGGGAVGPAGMRRKSSQYSVG